MNYTVNEAVKILGFSHQAIRYQIKTNLPDSMIEYRENGAVCVTEDGLAFLCDKMGKNAHCIKSYGDSKDDCSNVESNIDDNDYTERLEFEQNSLQDSEKTSSKKDVGVQELIDLLKQQSATLMEQLAAKDEQIASQARQIETLVESLKLAQQTAAAAQALHAGTLQKELSAVQPEPEVPEEPEAQTAAPPKISLWKRIKNFFK